jgi:hypothetical protein
MLTEVAPLDTRRIYSRHLALRGAEGNDMQLRLSLKGAGLLSALRLRPAAQVVGRRD